MTKLCFGNDDVFIDITLLNTLAVKIYLSIKVLYTVPSLERKTFCKNLPKFTKLMKIVKIDYKGQ